MFVRHFQSTQNYQSEDFHSCCILHRWYMVVPCHESDLPDIKIVKIGYELSQRTEDLVITRNEILVFHQIVSCSQWCFDYYVHFFSVSFVFASVVELL